jgi:hypothetical protein
LTIAIGAVAHVPTQWSGEAAEAGVVWRQKRQKRTRASEGSILLLRFITILRGIVLTLHLTAVSRQRERCSILARVAEYGATGC